MCSKYLLVALLFISIMAQCYAGCRTYYNTAAGMWDCGKGCTGTPTCGYFYCGNKDDMCYCDCTIDNEKEYNKVTRSSCKQTDKGWKWNNGIKNSDGSYALNGTKGDGKEYDC
jgi:hypothetical protein